jgi:protein-S-isoprenylcysteine O-methyltransferase Ste14
MNDLNKRAFSGLFFFVIAVAALLFIPIWTLNYWQAWVFLIVLSISVFTITLYLAKNDPKLLERRVSAGAMAEKERSQKIIQFVAQIAFILVFLVPAIDHRFSWFLVPAYVSIIGDLLVVIGLLIVFFVFKENTFTSAIIEVNTKQKVISTGPYAMVRHPMYIGAIIMLLGVPLALGSLWGELAVILISLVIIWRLIDEEKYLEKNLLGYKEYKNKVKYRLVPYIW